MTPSALTTSDPAALAAQVADLRTQIAGLSQAVGNLQRQPSQPPSSGASSSSTSSGLTLTMVSPVTLASGSGRTPVPWTTLRLGQHGCPVGAKFAYLFFYAEDDGSPIGGGTPQRIQVRSGASGYTYTAIDSTITIDDDDIDEVCALFVPLSGASLDYHLDQGFINAWRIDLYGWIT